MGTFNKPGHSLYNILYKIVSHVNIENICYAVSNFLSLTGLNNEPAAP
jgi:hypothetical protein